MHDRLSNMVARWLSHPTGFAQAVVGTLLFFVPAVFGWPVTAALFWYFGLCTFVSFATQFTLAYQNKKAELHMLNTMRLLVALAEEIREQQARQQAELEDIHQELDEEQ
jgi:low affinity Fe/Cu permease